MSYAAYLKTTRAMAFATGGQLISLAGGCYGVKLPVDGASLFLARCPDLGADPAYADWGAWLEDDEGERITGEFSVSIGFIRPRDYASAPWLALRSLQRACRGNDDVPKCEGRCADLTIERG